MRYLMFCFTHIKSFIVKKTELFLIWNQTFIFRSLAICQESRTLILFVGTLVYCFMFWSYNSGLFFKEYTIIIQFQSIWNHPVIWSWFHNDMSTDVYLNYELIYLKTGKVLTVLSCILQQPFCIFVYCYCMKHLMNKYYEQTFIATNIIIIQPTSMQQYITANNIILPFSPKTVS